MWVCGHEEVEEDGRDAGALRGTRPRVLLKGGGVYVSDAGHRPLDVGRHPALCVWSEWCGSEGGDEFSVDDHVESFGKINRHGHSMVVGIQLVEALFDLVGKGEEGSGGGPVGTKTMLSGGN